MAVPRAGENRGTSLTQHTSAESEARQEISMARGIRAQCLAAGRAPADIAIVIHDQCAPAFGTTLIRAHRMALGIALADVVAQVRARYVAEGRTSPRFSETLLSAYESGQKRPGPEYLHYLCCVYQAEPEDLGYGGPCLCGQRHRTPGLAPLPAPAAARPGPAEDQPAGRLARRPVLTMAEVPPEGPAEPAGLLPSAMLAGPVAAESGTGVGEADDDVVRRTLLSLMTGATGPDDGRFFGAAERIRRRLDKALLGTTASAAMLDHWEDMAAEYGRQYMTAPPLRLLCDILLDLGDVRRMCEQRQPLEFADRLCRLAVRLAGLAGLAMIDIGDQRMARSFFRTARTAADETGDRHLRAWVAVRESLVPLYYGDPAQAAATARASADLAGRGACVASVMAPVVEARALARLGRARCGPGGPGGEALRRARAALDRAHAVLDALPVEERRDTAFGYTERQLLFHQGDALVTLGDYLGAEDSFGQALRMYSRAEFLDRSLIALGQARCRSEAGEPEEALRLSRATLHGLASQQRPGIVLRAARSLGDAVAARHGDCRAVQDYREALSSA